MTQSEATTLAARLLSTFGEKEFEVSMADQQEYEIMRNTLADMGRPTGPDGEFFVVKVLPVAAV